MILYKDLDSLFEKFCVITVDGRLSDNEAFKFLADKTNKDLLNQLQIKVYQLNSNNQAKD